MVNKATPPPAGVLVPLPTFFKDDSSLDLETQGAHAVYLAKNGVKGVVLMGSTGEGVHIHPRERRVLISSVRQSLDKAGFSGYPVIAGTATHNIEETIEQLVEAKEAGAQWGQTLAPGYNAAVTNETGLVNWFTAVADRSPLPIVIYNYPGVTNSLVVKPSTFARVAQHPNIVGCKLSHGDLSLITQIILNPAVDNTHFHLYTGLGQLLVPAVGLGAAGAVDGTAGFFPKSLVRLYDLSAKEKLTPAELEMRNQLAYRVACMTEIVVKHGVPGIKEPISRLRGFGKVGGLRLPLSGSIAGGDAEWANWVPIMNAMEEIEESL